MTDNDKNVILKLDRIADGMLSGKCKLDLDIGDISAIEDESLRSLAQKLVTVGEEYRDSSKFITDLSNGKLNTPSPPKNAFAGPFKQLHSELRHLTWQIQQIADGDYSQKVSFSGDFSDAINKMIAKLRERRALWQQLRDSEAKLRQSAEQLDESNKTKDKLFSIIAHDLKGHFNVLLGLGELLTMEANKNNADIESIREFSTIIHNSASGAYGLLVNLLDWARLQSDHITVKPESLNLKDLILENMEIWRIMANNKNITLKYTGGQNDYTLQSDRAMINTVLRNLISNAIKYTPQGGQVTVHANSGDDNKYVISVQNSGAGIIKDILDKLFRSGNVSSTPGTASETGTGLGLGICKDFIDKLGGDIWAENVSGHGAVFSFSLKDFSTI